MNYFSGAARFKVKQSVSSCCGGWLICTERWITFWGNCEWERLLGHWSSSSIQRKTFFSEHETFLHNNLFCSWVHIDVRFYFVPRDDRNKIAYNLARNALDVGVSELGIFVLRLVECECSIYWFNLMHFASFRGFALKK